ncbi:MAG: hypothetical protein P8017_06530 [Deltaproteobacteria bacterium]
MEKTFEDLLSLCSEIDFGHIRLQDGEKEFSRQLNSRLFSLCKSMPEPVQRAAVLFLARYARISFDHEINFFRGFYAPAWSIIYWLNHADDEGRLSEDDVTDATTAHAMAMMLHSLDDHLNDGDMSATHLTLLLRSQAWLTMTTFFARLASRLPDGDKIVKHYIDNYYSAICDAESADSFDGYCLQFGRQMGTWMVVPVLLAKRMSEKREIIKIIQRLYRSFGIAWRLLDDINDISNDMVRGIHSSIYFCLSERIKTYWDKNHNRALPLVNSEQSIILKYIVDNGVIRILIRRIGEELASAAVLADGHYLAGWADEIRCLSKPLNNSLISYEKQYQE